MTTNLRPRLTRWALPLTVAGLTVTALPVTTAQAASSITGTKVVKVTHTSFTVRLDSQGSGWKYRLYASTNKPDVYFDNLKAAPYHTAFRSKPRLTLSNLPYRTKPYWWRIQAVKSGSHRTSDMFSLGLRPAAPAGLAAERTAGGGLALTWGGGASDGFQVQQAADGAFGSGVTTYSIRGTGRQFTPYGLTSGHTYYFRVRSSNAGTKSAWSPVTQGTFSGREQQVRIGTFNIHEETATNNQIPSWQDRRDAVVASIRQGGSPPVLAIEEGSSWTAGKCSPRQVDDLASHLGSQWVVAHTDPIPCKEPDWQRTGVYVVYNSDSYRAVGASGHWEVSTSAVSERNFVAYQELEDISSGARMLFVSVHLQKQQSLADDKERGKEAQKLLADVAALKLDVPVVFAGDFNSHDRRPYDGPGIVMRQAHVADAWFVAQKRIRPTYNTANNYQRRPPRTSTSIDHVYGTPGVGLKTWNQVMKIKSGAYVGVIPSDHNLLVSDITYPY